MKEVKVWHRSNMSKINKIFKKIIGTYFLSTDINRKFEKRVIQASNLYHRGGIHIIIALCIHNRNRKRFPCEIYPQVRIEGKISVPHCVGIVIGKTAVIGDGTKIMPNVVIGARFSPHRCHDVGRRHAIIGKNCMIGANAVIIGDIIIGDNVVVGAGAIITRDIPSNAIVTGHNIIQT